MTVRSIFKRLLRPMGTKAVSSQNQELPSGAQVSSLVTGITGRHPLRVRQLWSHSSDEGEEWLYLRLSPDGRFEPQTETLQSPVPDIRCRLVGAGDFSVWICP